MSTPMAPPDLQSPRVIRPLTHLIEILLPPVQGEPQQTTDNRHEGALHFANRVIEEQDNSAVYDAVDIAERIKHKRVPLPLLPSPSSPSSLLFFLVEKGFSNTAKS
ncbi:hypothetical protein BJ508DRAFT_128876 [Ascobolus immersus RN42]|uniref:Uncharacterized protein n=1 Tax=Ascobolus immersus RN42 TaxID=1160509 RepID=A0A3N4I2R9_ASCIM|nr:hypothetical protein BJ508DRAFT_128876 [Ascobolus immersus RN42]